MFEFKAILSVDAAMVAVESDGYALRYVPEALMNEAVVSKAVERNGDALRYVPEALMSEAVVSKAVERNGEALRYVPEALMNEAMVYKAVERNGYALQYVLNKSLFIKIAAKFGIRINIKDPLEKASKAYAAYCKQAGGITFDGKPLPTFEDLGEDRQQCWVAATDAMVEQSVNDIVG